MNVKHFQLYFHLFYELTTKINLFKSLQLNCLYKSFTLALLSFSCNEFFFANKTCISFVLSKKYLDVLHLHSLWIHIYKYKAATNRHVSS